MAKRPKVCHVKVLSNTVNKWSPVTVIKKEASNCMRRCNCSQEKKTLKFLKCFSSLILSKVRCQWIYTLKCKLNFYTLFKTFVCKLTVDLFGMIFQNIMSFLIKAQQKAEQKYHILIVTNLQALKTTKRFSAINTFDEEPINNKRSGSVLQSFLENFEMHIP